VQLAGVGKTILMSSAIDHLIENAALYGLHAVAYIYFNYKQRDAQSIENVLASLLVQLFEQVPACQVQVAELYDKSGEGKRKASFDDVFSLLLTISQSYRLSIVFDALDEASAKTRTALIQLLPKFELSKLFVLISSRLDVDLRLLAKLILTEDVIANSRDIEIYARARLEESQEVLDILGDHADMVIPEIVKNVLLHSAGM